MFEYLLIFHSSFSFLKIMNLYWWRAWGLICELFLIWFKLYKQWNASCSSWLFECFFYLSSKIYCVELDAIFVNCELVLMDGMGIESTRSDFNSWLFLIWHFLIVFFWNRAQLCQMFLVQLTLVKQWDSSGLMLCDKCCCRLKNTFFTYRKMQNNGIDFLNQNRSLLWGDLFEP